MPGLLRTFYQIDQWSDLFRNEPSSFAAFIQSISHFTVILFFLCIVTGRTDSTGNQFSPKNLLVLIMAVVY